MKLRYRLLVITALFIQQIVAQNPYNNFSELVFNPMRDSIAGSNIIETGAKGGFESNFLQNGFGLNFQFNNSILHNDLQTLLSDLNDVNLANYESKFHLEFYHFKNSFSIGKTKGWFWQAGISLQTRAYGELNSDLLGVLVKGNGPYAGQKVDLSPVQLFYNKYMDYSFGLTKSIQTQTKKGFFSINIHGLQGLDLIQYQAKTLTLFTEENGEYIDLHVDHSGYFSNSTTRGLKAYGAELDFKFGMQVNERSSFSISAEHLGSTFWKAENYSLTGKADIHIGPDSFTYAELLTANNDLSDTKRFDSLTSLLLPDSQQIARSFSQPIRVSFGYTTRINPFNYFELQCIYAFLPNYIPLINLNYRHFFKSSWYLSPGATFGGYSVMQFNLATGWQMKNGIFIMANLQTATNNFLRSKSTASIQGESTRFSGSFYRNSGLLAQVKLGFRF